MMLDMFIGIAVIAFILFAVMFIGSNYSLKAIISVLAMFLFLWMAGESFNIKMGYDTTNQVYVSALTTWESDVLMWFAYLFFVICLIMFIVSVILTIKTHITANKRGHWTPEQGLFD